MFDFSLETKQRAVAVQCTHMVTLPLHNGFQNSASKYAGYSVQKYV